MLILLLALAPLIAFDVSTEAIGPIRHHRS